MLLEITKKEMIEITLDKVLYVCYADSLYYRFTPKENNIDILYFSESSIGFELRSRNEIYEHEIEIVNLSAQYAKEITEDEFNTKLQEILLKYI